MITKAFALLDVKTGLFSVPWFLHHKAIAIRAVCELARDPNTNVGKYSTDYALYQIGEYDDCAGLLVSTGLDLVGPVAGLLAQEG